MLAREVDGRTFRLIGIGAHDLIEAGRATQGDLFGGTGLVDSTIDTALDVVRDRFGETAIVRGRNFSAKRPRA